MIEHFIGHGKVGRQHLTAELDIPVRIKIIGTPILWNLASEVEINP